ncbi:hypothetical protein Mal52_61970 [Symmachiella dynata]|uniref:Uncharacterized protein n=1 Tax=Symmachiella dynata TaxID=2527995 RepID=A0A517ZYU1_9PLAN|nr:hypothetical protein [Symmachiella dynata]QDU47662.1 hypothetical protein Mal52_61970 [Symmachiella dynata]
MFDAISRVMYHASPDMILEYMHKEAPNLGIELHDFAKKWEHDDAIIFKNRIAVPLLRRKWPTEPDDEMIWFLSEVMSSVSKNDTAGFLEMYLACLLLHNEALKGESAIPQSPICTAIITKHVLARADDVYTAMAFRFMLNTSIHRKTPFDDSVFPCPEMAIFILMLSMCESLSGIIGRGVENGSLPWLWSMDGKLSQDASLVAWQELAKEYRNRHPTHDFIDVIQSAIPK